MMLLMRAQALSGDGAGGSVALRDFAARIPAEIGEDRSRPLATMAERIRKESGDRPPGGERKRPSSVAPELHRTVSACSAAGIAPDPAAAHQW